MFRGTSVQSPTRIGVISDTHGLLRPEALNALRGSHHILHAGDVGDTATAGSASVDQTMLDSLRMLAPVTAIRGNIDRQGACALLPPTEAVELGGKLFYLVHSLTDLDLDPVAAQIHVIVSGHSHRSDVAWRDGILYLNPGSAGPRRFKLPISLASIEIAAGEIRPSIIEL